MKQYRGFTLIELLITIALAAILAATALPAMRDFVVENQAATQTNNIMTALTMARSEAIKLSATVTVCASSDNATCNGGTSWNTGLIMFRDSDDDGTTDTGETVLRVFPAAGSSFTLTSSSPFVLFYGSGFSNAAKTIAVYSTNNCTGNQQRSISVARTGRASVSKTACP